MKGWRIAAVPVLFVVALVASGCGSSAKKSATTATTSAGETASTIMLDGQSANSHGTKDVSGGGSQEVEVDSFYFNPTVFTAKAGDKLKLTLTNDSKTVHNFSVPELKIDRNIPAGGKTTLTVTFPKSGTLVFFCKFHRASGMIGGLQVEKS